MNSAVTALPSEASSSAWDQQSALLACLIGQAQAGSIQAFEELYNRTARWLLSHVRRIVEDGQAEDVLAEVYLQVWRTLANYDPLRAPPAVWLVMIARSRSLDHLRHEKSHGGSQSSAQEETASDDDCPEQILSRLEKRRMVQLGLQSLDEQEQLLLGMAYFRENSHREISELTGLPLGTVKSTIHRAQAKLRVRLGSWVRSDSTARKMTYGQT